MAQDNPHSPSAPSASDTPVDRTQTLAPKSDRSDRETSARTAPEATARAQATPPSPDRFGERPGERTDEVPLPTDDPDRYHPAGEHGRGGLGRVVRAHDTRLGRTVAVKELLRTSPQAEALFVREALITARLQHPGIVPVHEAGRWPSGDPYYVMKLVQGRTLKEVIAARATLAERLALLPHAIAVAEAIGYAHNHGVIHRDIKPANVMVGDFGETVVVDWGLARDHTRDMPDLDGELCARPQAGAGATASGRVIGTPQYMPPEQARGEAVDERGDVYSLGALCYELLAGRAPYAGEDPQAVLEAVVAGPPRRLAEVVPGVPRDLDAIIAKAMARNARDRYANGKELAEDLKRFQSGQLVRAHAYSPLSLVTRWVGRHRGPVAIAAVAMAVLVVSTAWMFHNVVDERNVARAATAQTREALGAAENRQHQLTLLQARRSLAQDPTAVIAWLKAYPRAQLADAEIPAMIDEAVAGGVARHVWREREFVRDVAFAPDGRTLATASKDGDVRVYDVASGAVRVLGHHDAGVDAVAWSPDGHTLATGGADGALALWNVAAGGSRVVGQQPEAITGLRWSPDGARLLSTGENAKPRVWDALHGGGHPLLEVEEILMNMAVPDDWSRAIAASAAGTIWRGTPGGAPVKIATVPGGIAAIGVSHDGAIGIVSDGRALWRLDVATGALTRLGDTVPMIKSIAFSLDGTQAAVGGEDSDIVLVDLHANTVERLRGHTDALYELRFSRDGHRLLSASDDGTARVWDLVVGGARVLRGHTDDVIHAVFSPDEDLVATASLDGSARLWPLGRQEQAIWGGSGPVERLVFLDDGKRVAALSYPGRASVYDLATGARTSLLSLDQAPASWASPRMPQVSPDGRWVALSRLDGTIAVWHDGAGPELLTGHTGWIVDGTFSPTGAAAYSASGDGTVRAWDLATHASRVIFRAARGDALWAIAISPDGKQLAVGAGEKIVLLDPAGTSLASLTTGSRPSRGCPRGLLFSPDGARLAIGRCDGNSVLIWNPSRGAPLALETSMREAVAYAFTPDGKRLAGAMADRTVRVWDATTGHVLATLGGHTDLVMAVAWSPDGKRLASASYDRTIRVWDPISGASRVLRGHEGSVDAIAWSSDGTRLYSGGRDGTVRVWNAPSLAPAVADEVRGSLDRVTSAQIARDDRPATPADTTPGG